MWKLYELAHALMARTHQEEGQTMVSNCGPVPETTAVAATLVLRLGRC